MKPHTIYAITFLLAILAALLGARCAMRPSAERPRVPASVAVLIPDGRAWDDGRLG